MRTLSIIIIVICLQLYVDGQDFDMVKTPFVVPALRFVSAPELKDDLNVSIGPLRISNGVQARPLSGSSVPKAQNPGVITLAPANANVRTSFGEAKLKFWRGCVGQIRTGMLRKDVERILKEDSNILATVARASREPLHLADGRFTIANVDRNEHPFASTIFGIGEQGVSYRVEANVLIEIWYEAAGETINGSAVVGDSDLREDRVTRTPTVSYEDAGDHGQLARNRENVTQVWPLTMGSPILLAMPGDEHK
jgi:hypothetical protein